MITSVETSLPITTKTNVLIVDDRSDGLLALEAVLSGESYNLVKASSGWEALQQALYMDFAVILLDVQMPELDGFETARLIRANHRSKNTPIIFVTAINKESQHINKGYESGAVDYIFKPLDPFILKSKVDVFVDLFNKNLQIKEQAALLTKLELREKERQISEFKQESLRRYVNLADAVPHMIIKIQVDGKPEYFNRQWYSYTGAGDIPEEKWKSFIHPQDRKNYLMFQSRIKREGLSQAKMELRLRRAEDGVYRWHLVRVVAETRGDKIIGWIGTCTDIDDIKKAEEKFRTLSEDLNRSNKELEQFAFVASHDLQEPLRIVNSYLDLLMLKNKDKIDDSAKNIIGITKTSIVRAQNLIRDLLEYARVGIKQRSFQEVELDSVLDQAIFNASLMIKERGARISRDPLPTIIVDQGQIVQLFQNLLLNAIKYCNGTPEIKITVKKLPHEWIFAFEDNGIGIDPQYHEKIFVIFQRLHLMNQYEGTGIGLAICKKIVERHKGRIWLESEVNKGTTFYFSIPRTLSA